MTLFRLRHAARASRRRAPGWILSILGVACLPMAARAEQPVETRLLKPIRGEVKIHWQARVLEPGGAFVVYRSQGAELEEVARLDADAGGSFEVVDRAWQGGRSTYQLRYRGRDRREAVLATSAVHLEVVDSAPAAGWLAGHAQPVTLPSALRTRRPDYSGPWVAAGPAPAGDRGRQPPTPPPRRA